MEKKYNWMRDYKICITDRKVKLANEQKKKDYFKNRSILDAVVDLKRR